MPTKISVFLWRLLHHALPTDLAVQQKGIQITSKCCCCILNPSIENSNHLLLQSEAACNIWATISSLMEVNTPRENLSQVLTPWRTGAAVTNLNQWLRLVVPAVALWQLWKSRNLAKFEGIAMKGEIILINIQRFVASLYSVLPVKLDSSDVSNSCMRFFSLCYYSKCHENIFVKWLPPIIHWHKLNCDGSSRGNPGPEGGGGIIRDHNGVFKLAYYDFYGTVSSMVAEAKSALRGLQLAVQTHSFIHLELDSFDLVQILRDGSSCP